MKGLSVNKKLWLIAGVYFIINAMQSFFTPLINDEAYYWVWSRVLSWGYYDHPPMVALWARLGFSIFENELGNRLFTILFASLGFVLLAKLLIIRTTEQLQLYASLFFSMILFQVFGFINTPDAPLLFFGILYLYILQKYLLKPSFMCAILLGMGMALLLYSKYHGILLILFTLLPHVGKLIKSKYFYIAVFSGILFYMPHIIWQFQNDFASLQYHLVRRNVHTSFKLNNLGDYLLSLIWASSPLLIYHQIKALIKTHYTTAFQKSLIYAVVGIIGFFILISFKRYIQAQWSLVAFIPAFILIYAYYKDNSKAIREIKILAICTMGLMLGARIYFVAQDVPFNTQYHGWKAFSKKAGEVTKGIAVFEKYQYTSLFNFNNYPYKKAHNYITLENRASQYNLMDSEAKLEGKEVTYFSKYISSPDSIILEKNNPEAVFYYKHIPIFHSAVHVQMHFSSQDVYKTKDSLHINLHLYNAGDYAVNLSPQNHFKLVKVTAEKPYAHQILQIEDVQYQPVILQPHQSATMSVVVSNKTFKAHAHAVNYFGWVYEDLPPKIQSNYIEDTIKP